MLMRPLCVLLLLACGHATAQNKLSGDQSDACSALLCLSSSQRPSECEPPIRRYFSISYKKLSDTLRGRRDFLNLCPTAQADGNMQTLVNDIANGAGRCDVASLNRSGSNGIMPGYCTSYRQNAYTDFKEPAPMYVGASERGGLWVEAAQYPRALKEYNARVAAEDAATSAFNNSGG